MSRFGKITADVFQVIRRIDTDELVMSLYYFYLITIFENPQLFQGLDFFCRRLFHGRVLQEEVPAIGIDTDVLIGLDAPFFKGVARVRDEGARKIHGFILLVEDDFDGTRVVVFVFLQRRSDGSHGQVRFRFKGPAQVVDDVRRDERFVALDIDDDVGIGK